MYHNVLEYLEASSERYPDKIAVADEAVCFTYGELHKKAQIIGSRLCDRVNPCEPVVIYMDKGCDTLALFLGSVYAGAFYVLLDPAHPSARVEKILQVLNAKILVTNKVFKEKAGELSFQGEVLDEEVLSIGQINLHRLEKVRRNSVDIDPLYANFTSGSTGIPKGVIVNHRSVIEFIECFTDLFHITPKDIIGNQAPFDFDVSVKDIYSCLKCGAELQIIPRRLFSAPTDLLDYLEDRQITTLIWAVSALCMITMYKGFNYKTPGWIQKILFSGEVMPIRHLNIWREKYPNALFVNLYGPTEITCNCTYHIIDRVYGLEESIPIGKSFPNERVFLLDEDDRVIPSFAAGKLGEICVSGTAVAMGYYNDEERTRISFVQNPLNKSYLEPIYRTGDLARYDEEENLHFITRKDFQIKHMGHRIELGEIESHIERLKGIDRACCIYEKDKIYAFYVGEVNKKEILSYLLKHISRYMIPGSFIKIDSFPLTKNGKIDRKQLQCLLICKGEEMI